MLQQQKLVSDVLWAILVPITKGVNSRIFDHEGVYQLQNGFVAGEYLRGTNVVQLTPFVIATRTSQSTSETETQLRVWTNRCSLAKSTQDLYPSLLSRMTLLRGCWCSFIVRIQSTASLVPSLLLIAILSWPKGGLVTLVDFLGCRSQSQTRFQLANQIAE